MRTLKYSSKIDRYTTIDGEKRIIFYRSRNRMYDKVDLSESEYKKVRLNIIIVKICSAVGVLYLPYLFKSLLPLFITPIVVAITFEKMWKDLKEKYG